VAIKGCSIDIAHKSEHGLVALNVADEDEAARVFEQQWARLGEVGARRDGVIVAAMHHGRHEFMVGARFDPLFGPIVVVGDGGQYVEALNDCSILLPPFDASEVKEALHRLHIAPLLEGVRGEPPLDLDALATVAVGVGQLIQGAEGRIASLDANPVIVGSAAEGAIIVDALIERGQ
jgi:acyl-CoA synthetase (NDP forming)